MRSAGSGPAPPYPPWRAIILGGTGLAVCQLPLFLTGALAVEMTDELGFGTAGLGMAVAVNRLASAPTAVFAGRLADHIGASRSLRLAGAAAAVACAGVAFVAWNWLSLALWLALAGCAMSLADPATNRLLVNVIPAGRLGRAFGFKQSAPPTASMLAGLSVPVAAVLMGWRSAFALAALAAVILTVAVGSGPARAQRTAQPRRREQLLDPVTILLLSTAVGLATASSTVIPAFYVTSAAQAGSAAQNAGAALAVASVVTIATRVAAGLVVDRFVAGHLRLCAAGQIAGCAGLLLLATRDPSLMRLGVVLALAGTWGFHGVFWFALVRARPGAPGAMTGAVAPGALLGGVIGPLAFGALASVHGSPAGWLFATGTSVLAAVVMVVGERRLSSGGR